MPFFFLFTPITSLGEVGGGGETTGEHLHRPEVIIRGEFFWLFFFKGNGDITTSCSHLGLYGRTKLK